LKLCRCCHLALKCKSLANQVRAEQTDKIVEIVARQRKLNMSMAHPDMTLADPTLIVNQCCFLSAVECFRHLVESMNSKFKKIKKNVI
uniref:Uncharacterized protein n=1 Tax=Oncorhynchus mykiss TaxID=8022 RepID=A0A8L0DVJ2_ONCMY